MVQRIKWSSFFLYLDTQLFKQHLLKISKIIFDDTKMFHAN